MCTRRRRRGAIAAVAARSTSSRVSSPGSSGRAKGNIGLEFAGEVESVGSTVKELSVGDRVFGIGSGTNAEFVCVREEGVVARIPPVLTFEEAAAVADGALSAISPPPHLAPREGHEDPCLRRIRIDRSRRRAGGEARGRPRHGRLPDEERRPHALAGGRRCRRLPERRLHQERQDVRRHPRCGRQDLVPPLPAVAAAGRNVRDHRSRLPVARRPHLVDDEKGEARHRPLDEGRPLDSHEADRGRRLQPGDRPHLSARGSSRGAPVCPRRTRRPGTSC